MKLEFNSLEEVRQFAERVFHRNTVTVIDSRPHGSVVGDIVDAVIVGETPRPDVQPQPEQQPARKKRSDAGQPRGPHNKGEGAGIPASSVTGADAPVGSVGVGAKAGDPVPSTSSPATLTAAVTSPPSAAPTAADARAALKRISDHKKLGPEKCIPHLQEFGVNQLSKLPEAMFAAFIASADAKVAAAT